MDAFSKAIYYLMGWRVLGESGSATVLERGSTLSMHYGSVIYSEFNRDRPYTHAYWDYFIPLFYAAERPSVLMIGCGGGTNALQLHALRKGKYSLDIVENDRGIATLAKRHFLNGEGSRIIDAEGASYVAKTKKSYDLIILDAFVDDKIPEQFYDEAFAKNARTALKSEGVLAVNASGRIYAVRKLIKRLRKRFVVYSITPSLMYPNVILLCLKSIPKGKLLSRIKECMPMTTENERLLNVYKGM